MPILRPAFTPRDVTAAKEKSRRPKPALLVLAGFGIGVGLCRLAGVGLNHNSDAATTPAPVQLDGGGDDAGPTRHVGGVPAGFAASPVGAQAAAVAYLRMASLLIGLDGAQAEAAVRRTAAEGSADAQVAETAKRLVELRKVLASGSGATRYSQAVLATRVYSFTPGRARVAVWNVGVLARQGAAPPQASWSVDTFDLVWEHDDWKVWAVTTAAGPTPTLAGGSSVSSAVLMEARLSGFTAWGLR